MSSVNPEIVAIYGLWYFGRVIMAKINETQRRSAVLAIADILLQSSGKKQRQPPKPKYAAGSNVAWDRSLKLTCQVSDTTKT